jgi:hypothetical protein
LFGEHATGGAAQMYLPQADITGLFGKSGYTPLLTTGGATAAQETLEQPTFQAPTHEQQPQQQPTFETPTFQQPQQQN